MPAFISAALFARGGPSGNTAWWISAEVLRPARRTTICPFSSFHSSTAPGPTPSFLRTSTGTEICPCAVTFDCASDIGLHYHGNGLLDTPLREIVAGAQEMGRLARHRK